MTLFDLFVRSEIILSHSNAHWVSLESRSKPSDTIWPCGTKHESLPRLPLSCLFDDASYIILKSLVEHAIRLIQNQKADTR